MNDFKSLEFFGFAQVKNEYTSKQNKGHTELIHAFFNAVMSYTPLPISFERLHDVAYTTLLIDTLVQKAGGSHEFC